MREKVNFIVNYLKFLGFSKCSNKTPTCMWVNWLFKKKYLFTEIFTLWWSFHYETIIWIKIIKCALFKMNVWNNRKAIIYLLNFHHFYSKSISFKLHLIFTCISLTTRCWISSYLSDIYTSSFIDQFIPWIFWFGFSLKSELEI